MSTEFYWVAVAAVTVISAGRFTRLATVDKFPPVRAVREWYEEKTEDTGWVWLVLCGYCFSFWATLFVIGWGLLAGVYDAETPAWGTDNGFAVWWIVNGVFAASYLAAMVMAFDGSSPEDEGEGVY